MERRESLCAIFRSGYASSGTPLQSLKVEHTCMYHLMKSGATTTCPSSKDWIDFVVEMIPWATATAWCTRMTCWRWLDVPLPVLMGLCGVQSWHGATGGSPSAFWYLWISPTHSRRSDDALLPRTVPREGPPAESLLVVAPAVLGSTASCSSSSSSGSIMSVSESEPSDSFSSSSSSRTRSRLSPLHATL